MDINDFRLFDLTSIVEPEKQDAGQVKLYAREKSMYLSYVAYGVLALTVVALAMILIFGLPHKYAVWWGIPIYLYTCAHVVAFVFCKKNRKKLKISGEKKEYNNIATSFFILSFMLSLSMMMMFIGRAINANFMVAL